MAFKTLAEVKVVNKEIGNHFFDRSSMRFFNSVIESNLYGGRYFITSERMELTMPKRYTIREVMPTGEVKTSSDFQKFSSLDAAREAAKRALIMSV